MRLIGVVSVAFWTVLLTGLYPIWFAQSSLAQADIFAAACSLWGLVYALPGRGRKLWAAALWFSAAALCKETAVSIPLTLAAVDIAEGIRHGAPARIPLSTPRMKICPSTPASKDRPPGAPVPWGLWRQAAWLCACVLPLAAWYAYHYAKTGFLFGNREFLRYNAQATLIPRRILAAFGHRILQLTAHMNLFVPVLMALAALLLDPRPDAEGHDRAMLGPEALLRIFLLLLVNALLFSVLGGALLARYLLTMYPLVLLVAVSTFYRRVPYWQGLALLSAAAFLVALFLNPPYGFAPEDNLAYAHVVRMHQAGIARLTKLYPGATVLTAWPATDELTKPELGYVKHPWEVCAIDDFTAAQIDRAAQEPQEYSAALIFATKDEPAKPILNFGEALDERYFGLHHDLPPERIAGQLGGTLIWKRDDDGMWIALLRFNRQIEAHLEQEDGERRAGRMGDYGGSPIPVESLDRAMWRFLKGKRYLTASVPLYTN
jgi:hypothetical protein